MKVILAFTISLDVTLNPFSSPPVGLLSFSRSCFLAGEGSSGDRVTANTFNTNTFSINGYRLNVDLSGHQTTQSPFLQSVTGDEAY